jgi:hypothetical protein
MRWFIKMSILWAVGCVADPSQTEPVTSLNPDTLLAKAVADGSTAEEWFFADNNRYTYSLDVSPFELTLPPGISVEVIWASAGGFALVATRSTDPERVCIYTTDAMGIEALWKAGYQPRLTGTSTGCMFPETVQCFGL